MPCCDRVIRKSLSDPSLVCNHMYIYKHIYIYTIYIYIYVYMFIYTVPPIMYLGVQRATAFTSMLTFES